MNQVRILDAKHLEDTNLDDCQVSCMIQLGDKLVIADNQNSHPEVKLFGAQSKQIDKETLEKSRIRDMTKVRNNTFAVLNVVYGWIFVKKSSITLMEVTREETLETKPKFKDFPYEITALGFTNDSYFMARRSKSCIEVHYMDQDGSQLVQAKSISYKDLSCGLPSNKIHVSKIHVSKEYKMIISDSIGPHVIMCTYNPTSGHVKNIKHQKYNVLDIEPIPDGTILLATAENTSIVKLFPDANSANNNNIETDCFPCGVAYNNETAKLQVVAKERPTYWDKISFGWFKKKYITKTYQCKFYKATDTVIEM